DLVQRHRQHRHRDALPRGDQHVHLARRRVRGHLLGEVDQIIGGVAHRGDHDDHLVTGLRVEGDALRDALDGVGVSDGGSSEFLDDQAHGAVSFAVEDRRGGAGRTAAHRASAAVRRALRGSALGGAHAGVRRSGSGRSCGRQFLRLERCRGGAWFRRTEKRSTRSPDAAPSALQRGTSRRPVYENAWSWPQWPRDARQAPWSRRFRRVTSTTSSRAWRVRTGPMPGVPCRAPGAGSGWARAGPDSALAGTGWALAGTGWARAGPGSALAGTGWARGARFPRPGLVAGLA